MSKKNSSKSSIIKRNTNRKKYSLSGTSLLLTSAAAFFGVVVGVMGSLGFVGNYLHNQFAGENAALTSQISSLKRNLTYNTAAFTSSSPSQCSLPVNQLSSNISNQPAPQPFKAANIESAAQTTTNSTAPSVPSHPTSSISNPFIQKLTNGVFTTTGTISTTGPQSRNNVTTNNTAKMTLTNKNNISISTSNPQTSTSGSSTLNENTNSGSATSGNSSNTSSTNLDIKVQN